MEVLEVLTKALTFPASVLLRKASSSSSLVAQILTKTGQVSHRAQRKFNPNLPEKLGEAEALTAGVGLLSQLATSGVLGGYIKYRNKLKEDKQEMRIQKLENGDLEKRVDEVEKRVEELEKESRTHSQQLAEIAIIHSDFRAEMANFKKKFED